jgi:hypothetical protein
MVTDPNIILAGNQMAQPRLPDVNAMMQTRTAGLENIYQIEAGRQEQAKADAKAQEDAAVEALLPAYAHAFKTGDMRGALKFVPPQYQDGLLPYVEALDGRPLEEIQSALTGSLVTSEPGRAFLENLNRVTTAGIQQGQLDVSRQDLALRRQKQALDARGEGEWTWTEGVDASGNLAFAWVNPRTRQVEMADVTGGAAPGATPAPDVVTPRQPMPGMPDVAPPPAGAAQPPAFRPKPKAEKEDDFTEREGKSVNFAIRMADSDAVTNELEAEGVVTTDTLSNFFTGFANAFPTVAGANLATQLENAFNAAMPTLSPEEQRLAGAQLDFITAVLRSESGAEIKGSEFPAEYRKYFAVAGDTNNPKLLGDKKRRRRNAIEGMKAQAGKRGRAEIDRIIAEQGAGAPAATVPTAPGATVDGFEYQGVEE